MIHHFSKKTKSILVASLALVIVCAACAIYFVFLNNKGKEAIGKNAMEKITVDRSTMQFVDQHGQIRIFHGVNLVCKDKSLGYIGNWTEQDFKQMHDMGINVVRLGFIWDGVEPEPNVFDDAYLNKMGAFFDYCEKYNIYVIIDMHQDLFSAEYSDGAPAWATIIDQEPSPISGGVWSDAYLTSTAIQRAFDHFFKDDVKVDNVSLQDHFANAWSHIIKKFGNRPNILGYDFWNEPFPGSASTDVLGALLSQYTEVLNSKTGSDKSIDDVMNAFMTNRDELLQFADDKDTYAKIVNAAAPLVQKFDRDYLMPFYQKMDAATRKITSNGIVFMENDYFSNMGVPSGVEALPGEANQAYAPHGYDLVVDTAQVGNPSLGRIGVIFGNHKQVSQTQKLPVLVGEWGAFSDYTGVTKACNDQLNLFDSNLWSFTYWAWRGTNENNEEVMAALERPYPAAAAGLKAFAFDPDKKVFQADWSGNQATIFIPGSLLSGMQIVVSQGCSQKLDGNFLIINSPKTNGDGNHVTITFHQG